MRERADTSLNTREEDEGSSKIAGFKSSGGNPTSASSLVQGKASDCECNSGELLRNVLTEWLVGGEMCCEVAEALAKSSFGTSNLVGKGEWVVTSGVRSVLPLLK